MKKMSGKIKCCIAFAAVASVWAYCAKSILDEADEIAAKTKNNRKNEAPLNVEPEGPK